LGEREEVNPCVERMKWQPYLMGMDRAELIACIEEPVAEPDPRNNDKGKPIEAALWAAMVGLARSS
jgi:hypothetical protein